MGGHMVDEMLRWNADLSGPRHASGALSQVYEINSWKQHPESIKMIHQWIENKEPLGHVYPFVSI